MHHHEAKQRLFLSDREELTFWVMPSFSQDSDANTMISENTTKQPNRVQSSSNQPKLKPVFSRAFWKILLHILTVWYRAF